MSSSSASSSSATHPSGRRRPPSVAKTERSVAGQPSRVQSPPSKSITGMHGRKKAQPALPPSLSHAQQPSPDHQRRLEEASVVCARGRQYWTQDRDAVKAVAEFERALRLLETLLGTYHSLTAKTYYWLGFIRKHSPKTYPEALQAFVQTARIRLVLLGPSHESTQESIAAIRWVLLNQQKWTANTASTSTFSSSSFTAATSGGGGDFIKQYLSNLYESIRLETLGDARLRHREYSQAIDHYQRAMTTFPDPTHATIMGKRAFCCFKRGELDEALYWYRQALLIFTTQTVHRESHPDLPTTLERLQQVLQSYASPSNGKQTEGHDDTTPRYSTETIQTYCSMVLRSVQLQYEGQIALDQGKVTQARNNFELAIVMESNLLGANHALVIETLQPLVDLTIQLSNHTHLEKTMAELQQQKKHLEERLDAIQSVVDDTDDQKDTAASGVSDTTSSTAATTTREQVVDSSSVVLPTSSSSTTRFSSCLTPSMDQINEKFQSIRASINPSTDKQRNVDLDASWKTGEQERQEWQAKSEMAQIALVDLHAKIREVESAESTIPSPQTTKLVQKQQQKMVEKATKEEEAEKQSTIQLLKEQIADRDRRLEELQALTQSQEQKLEDYHAKMQSHSEKVEAWQSKVEALEKETLALRTVTPTKSSALRETTISAKELEEAKQATKNLESSLHLAEGGMAYLKEENELSQRKLEESLDKQNTLSKQLQESATIIEQLQDQIIKLEMTQSDLREKLSQKEEVSGDTRVLETPVVSPARPKATTGASPGGVSMVSMIEPDPRSTELKARRLEAELQDLSQEFYAGETDDRIVRNKLESQNERAVKTIKALSNELIGIEEKYRKLFAKHERLRLLFVRLEAKNRTLKEKSVRNQQQHREQQSLSSSSKVSEVTPSCGRNLSTGTTPSLIIEKSSSSKTGVNERPHPSEALLKSVRLSTSSYKSTLANYIIRRPFLRGDELSDEERRYFFEVALCASSDWYVQHAHLNDPTTIELVAIIGFDESRLYMVDTPCGETKIFHRRTEGDWVDLGTLESNQNSNPFGWVALPSPTRDLGGVTSTTTPAAPLYYSLDDIMEEAQIYRQHYCQAVSLNAASGGMGLSLETKLLRWFAARTKSSYLESLAYSYESKAFEKQTRILERPGYILLFLTTFLVFILAMLIAQYR